MFVSSLAETKRQLERLPELRSLIFGLVMGIVLSVFAQLLLKPLNTMPENSTLVLYYGGARLFQIGTTLYVIVFGAALCGALYAGNMGYHRLRGLHTHSFEKYSHTEPIDTLARAIKKELSELSDLRGLDCSSSKTGDDYRIAVSERPVQATLPMIPLIPISLEGNELLVVVVQKGLVTMEYLKDEKVLELAEKVDMFLRTHIHRKR
jgi:hypothetical protein